MRTVPMNPKVLAALIHVRHFIPEVCMAVFSKDQMWQFFGEDFAKVEWSDEIDTSIIEAAVDAAYETVGLPAVFELDFTPQIMIIPFNLQEGILVDMSQPDTSISRVVGAYSHHAKTLVLRAGFDQVDTPEPFMDYLPAPLNKYTVAYTDNFALTAWSYSIMGFVTISEKLKESEKIS